MSDKINLKLETTRSQPSFLPQNELTEQELYLIEGGTQPGFFLNEKKQAPGIIGVLKTPENLLLNFSRK